MALDADDAPLKERSVLETGINDLAFNMERGAYASFVCKVIGDVPKREEWSRSLAQWSDPSMRNLLQQFSVFLRFRAETLNPIILKREPLNVIWIRDLDKLEKQLHERRWEKHIIRSKVVFILTETERDAVKFDDFCNKKPVWNALRVRCIRIRIKDRASQGVHTRKFNEGLMRAVFGTLLTYAVRTISHPLTFDHTSIPHDERDEEFDKDDIYDVSDLLNFKKKRIGLFDAIGNPDQSKLEPLRKALIYTRSSMFWLNLVFKQLSINLLDGRAPFPRYDLRPVQEPQYSPDEDEEDEEKTNILYRALSKLSIPWESKPAKPEMTPMRKITNQGDRVLGAIQGYLNSLLKLRDSRLKFLSRPLGAPQAAPSKMI